MRKLRRYCALAIAIVLLSGWLEPIAVWAAGPKADYSGYLNAISFPNPAPLAPAATSNPPPQGPSALQLPTVPYSMPVNTPAALGQPYDGIDFTSFANQNNMVYFGNYNMPTGIANGGVVSASVGYPAPVPWQVMGEENNEGYLTLFSRYALTYMLYNSSTANTSNYYANSAVNTFVTGLTSNTSTFSSVEQSNMMATNVVNALYDYTSPFPQVTGTVYGATYPYTMTNQKLYLPWGVGNNLGASFYWSAGNTRGSNVQIPANATIVYVYPVNSTSAYSAYFMRNSYYYNTMMAQMAHYNGGLYGVALNLFQQYAIRPLFKFNPNNIIMAHPVLNSTTGNSSAIQSVAGYYTQSTFTGGTNYKLVLQDTSMPTLSNLSYSSSSVVPSTYISTNIGTAVSLNTNSGGTGGTYSINYKIVQQNATTGVRSLVGYGTGTATGTVAATNNTVQIQPKALDGTNLPEGEYTVYTWLQANNNTQSHVGSVPQRFTLVVSNNPPAITGISPSGTVPATTNSIVINFNKAMNATGGTISLQNTTDNTAVDITTATQTWSNGGKTLTISPVSLTAGKSYTVTASGFTDTANLHAATGTSNFNIVLSSNANLGSLVVTGGTLSPAFDPNTTSYTATIPYTMTDATFTDVPQDANASASLTSFSQALAYNASVTKTITVTAQDGTTKTYTITITRSGIPLPTVTVPSTVRADKNLVISLASASSQALLDYKAAITGIKLGNHTLTSGQYTLAADGSSITIAQSAYTAADLGAQTLHIYSANTTNTDYQATVTVLTDPSPTVTADVAACNWTNQNQTVNLTYTTGGDQPLLDANKLFLVDTSAATPAAAAITTPYTGAITLNTDGVWYIHTSAADVDDGSSPVTGTFGPYKIDKTAPVDPTLNPGSETIEATSVGYTVTSSDAASGMASLGYAFAAVPSGSAAPSASPAWQSSNTGLITGLTNGASYDLYAMTRDAAGNQTAWVLLETITARDHNATLKMLAANNGTLSPAFDPATTSYTLDLPYSSGIVTLTAVTTAPTSTATVDGQDLSNTFSIPYGGSQTIDVVVTAQDGTQKTYTVTINRPFVPLPSITLPNTVEDDQNLVVTLSGSGTLAADFAGQITGIELNGTTLTASQYTIAADGSSITIDQSCYTAANLGNPQTLTILSANTTNTSYSDQFALTTNPPPSVTADVSTAAWTNADQAVNLTYTSGGTQPLLPANKTYLVDSNAATPAASAITTPYTGAISLANEGVWYIHYAALDVDYIGGAVTGTFGPYKIDKTPPVNPVAGTGTPGTTSLVAAASSSDAASGMAASGYAFAAVPAGAAAPTASPSWTAANTATLTGLSPATAYDVYAMVRDAAGNKTAWVKISTATTLSNDTSLQSLTADSGSMTPAFDPATSSYTLTIPYNQGSVTLNAVPTASSAVAAVDGTPGANTFALAPGETKTVAVVVTAQDGTTKTYNVTITRPLTPLPAVNVPTNVRVDHNLVLSFSGATAQDYLSTVTGVSLDGTPLASGQYAIDAASGTLTIDQSCYDASNIGTPLTLQLTAPTSDGSPYTATFNVTAIDAPIVSASEATFGWTNQPPQISLTYTSGGANPIAPNHQTYLVDTNAATPAATAITTPYTGAITLPGEGVYYIHYAAFDPDYNATDPLTGTFGPYQIDTTAPAAPALDSQLVGATAVTATVSSSDSASGIATDGYGYAILPAGSPAPAGPPTWENAAAHTFAGLAPATGYDLWAIALDAAGNQSAWTKVGSLTTLSNNAKLANITSSAGTFSPVFAPATTSYTVHLAYNQPSTLLTATTENFTAAATVDGTPNSNTIAVGYGQSVAVPVVSTAQDGTQQNYTVTVTRDAIPTPDMNTPASVQANKDLVISLSGTGTLTADYTAQITAIKFNGTTLAAGDYTIAPDGTTITIKASVYNTLGVPTASTIEMVTANTATPSVTQSVMVVPVDRPFVLADLPTSAWTKNSLSVNLSYNVAAGNTSTNTYLLDTSPTTPAASAINQPYGAGPLSITSTGVWYIHYAIDDPDYVGGVVTGTFGPYQVDKTAPDVPAAGTSAATGTTLNLTVNTSDADSGIAPAGYGFAIVPTGSGNTPSYQWLSGNTVIYTGLLPGTSYDIWAKATDAAGNTSAAVNLGAFSTLSNTTLLSNITTSAGTLSPVFDPATKNYTVTLPWDAPSTILTATGQTSLEAVTVGGAPNANTYTLNYGQSQNAQVKVTAQDGTVDYYAVTVTRQPIPQPVIQTPANVTAGSTLTLSLSGSAAQLTAYAGAITGIKLNGVLLAPGDYTIAADGSSITVNGSLFGPDAAATPQNIEIVAPTAQGPAYTATFSIQPGPAPDVTADQANTAGWVNTPPTVHLTYGDGAGGTLPLANCKYVLSQSSTAPSAADISQPYDPAAGIPITGNGTWYIYYSALSETYSSQPVLGRFGPYQVDTSPPPIPDLVYARSTATSITVSASDTGGASGLNTGGAYAFRAMPAGSPAPAAGSETWDSSSVYNDTGLTPGTSYDIWVSVRDAAGNITGWTLLQTVSTHALSEAPPFITADIASQEVWTNQDIVVQLDYVCAAGGEILPADKKFGLSVHQLPAPLLFTPKMLMLAESISPTLMPYAVDQVYDGTPITFSTDGAHYIDASVADQYYQNAQVVTRQFGPYNVDKTPPTGLALVEGSATAGSITAAMTATDETSGLAVFGYALAISEGGAMPLGAFWQDTPTRTFTGTTPGSQYTIWGKAKDKAGNETKWVKLGALTAPGTGGGDGGNTGGNAPAENQGKTAVPKTGDAFNSLWIAAGILALAGLTACATVRKRRKKYF